MVELGGQSQQQVFLWYHANWEAYRTASRQNELYNAYQWGQQIQPGFIPGVFDLELQDVGDWHRHPGDMNYPSPGDLGTAISTLMDSRLGVHHLIAPIVTVQNKRGGLFKWEGMAVSHADPDYSVGIDFYYISRRMLRQGLRQFVHVQPVIVEDDLLPCLPPLSWHLNNPARFRQEYDLLVNYGCEVRVVTREMNGQPPLEVCFALRHPDWQHTLFIESDVSYPNVAPKFRVIGGEVMAEQPAPTPEVVQDKPGALADWWSKVWKRGKKVEPEPTAPPTGPSRTPTARGAGSEQWQTTSTLLGIAMRLWVEGKLGDTTTITDAPSATAVVEEPIAEPAEEPAPASGGDGGT
jgi:hypothetical protein